MKNTTIPKPNSLVYHRSALFAVVSVSVGGKCKLRLCGGKKVLNDVDVSELKPYSESK